MTRAFARVQKARLVRLASKEGKEEFKDFIATPKRSMYEVFEVRVDERWLQLGQARARGCAAVA